MAENKNTPTEQELDRAIKLVTACFDYGRKAAFEIIPDLKKQLEESKRIAHNLRQRIDILESGRASDDNSEMKINDAERQIADLKVELQELRTQYAALGEDYKNYKAKKREEKYEREQNGMPSVSVSSSAGSDLPSYRKTNSSSEDVKLRSKNAELSKKNEELRSCNVELNAKIETLTQDLQKQINERAEMYTREQYDALYQKYLDLQKSQTQNAEEHREQIAEVMKEKQDLEQEKQNLNSQITDLRSKITLMESELNKYHEAEEQQRRQMEMEKARRNLSFELRISTSTAEVDKHPDAVFLTANSVVGGDTRLTKAPVKRAAFVLIDGKAFPNPYLLQGFANDSESYYNITQLKNVFAIEGLNGTTMLYGVEFVEPAFIYWDADKNEYCISQMGVLKVKVKE